MASNGKKLSTHRLHTMQKPFYTHTRKKTKISLGNDRALCIGPNFLGINILSAKSMNNLHGNFFLSPPFF